MNRRPVCVSCGRSEALEGELICYDCAQTKENIIYKTTFVYSRSDFSDGELTNAYEFARKHLKTCDNCGETICTAEMAQFCEFVRVGGTLIEKELSAREGASKLYR